ncbi:MAG: TonB-dependent receptor [Woeseiaceae bacterium]|nr:TonB-dependent receptor [Woeseiaceae bacterium]
MASNSFKVTALSAGIAVALGTAPPTLAQEGEIEEIVVTGSHIRRTEYEGRAPIQIVDAQTIELSGASQPVEILKQLSVNSGSEIYSETGTRGGISQFNVRNLGLGSTLTLINGKRAGISAAADATGTDFVDINQFPLAMIERVEVLTNGASATYGSQAVAGVANLITRKGFEGLEVSGGYADSENDHYYINLAAGAQFDRGGFNIYATYYEQEEKNRTEYDWLNLRLNGNGDQRRSSFLSGTGSPGSYERATLNADGEAASVSVPNPAFDPACTVDCEPEFLGAVRQPDPDCEAAGGVIADPAILSSNTCRYNFADQVSVLKDEQRAQVFTEFDWELTDSVKYYAEASFSNNQIESDLGGQLLSTGRAPGNGVTILPSHPFNFFVEDPADPLGREILWIGPDNWDPTIHCTDITSAPTCQFQTATLRGIHRPLGPSITNTPLTEQATTDVDYARIMQGLEIDLPGDWFLDMSYMWAKAQWTDVDPSGIRSDTYQDLVRAGTWNPFGTRDADPTLESPKDAADTANCFNIDLGYCAAANSNQVRRQWNNHSVAHRISSEKVVDLVASGELFETGFGTVAAAVGGQFRDIEYVQDPDSLSAAGEGGQESTETRVRGRQDVVAFFAEVVVPIYDTAELQLAVRNEDYGEGVSTTDPKFSVEWGINDLIGVRGSWGTSFQAPTVRQKAQSSSSLFISDPASATGPGGSFVCTNTGVTNNITTIVEGAPDLQPQESENINLGVVFTTDNFRASIDYFNFDYTSLIGASTGAQAQVDGQCAGIENSGLPIIPNPNVTRDATGQVREVRSQFVNIGSVETDGIDVNADYTMEIGNGTIVFDLGATFLNKFDVDTDGDGINEFDGAGSRNFSNSDSFGPMPELRGNLAATWFSGNHVARLGLNHIDSYKNDQGNDREIDAWTTLDAMYSYTFSGLVGDGDTTLTLGVNNIADKDPPGLVVNNADGTPQERFNPNGTYNRNLFNRPGYDARAGHDLRGRIVYVRFKHLF